MAGHLPPTLWRTPSTVPYVRLGRATRARVYSIRSLAWAVGVKLQIGVIARRDAAMEPCTPLKNKCGFSMRYEGLGIPK